MTNIEKAFLDTISYVEGTLGVSQNGYDVSVGYRKIIGWTENTKICHGGKPAWYLKEYNSTATGRYQFTYDTWLGVNGGVNKPMTRTNQDNGGLKLINMRKKSTFDISTIENLNQFSILVNQLKSTWDGFNHKPLNDAFKIFNEALVLYNG